MSTLTLDPAKSALILIDLQNALMGMTLAPHSVEDVVARGAALAAAFREKGGTVVYVTVNLADFVQLIADAPGRDPNAPIPPGALEIAAAAGFTEGDLHIVKRYWGAFIGTDLEAQLRSRGVDTVVVGGIATNYGVESTAREAAGLGFNVVLPEDAMTSISTELHQFPIASVFPRLGRVRSTEQVIAAITMFQPANY